MSEILSLDTSPNESDSDFFEYNYDPLTGIREYMRLNEDGGITIRRYQDVEQIMDTATAERNMSEKSTPYGDMCRMASIPLTLYYDPNLGLQHGGAEAMRRFLRDRDFAKFRTRVGTI